jgi:hypothetical protein
VRILLAALLSLALTAAAAAATTPQLVAQRTGGIAGVQDRLTLAATGSAVVTHRQGAPLRVSSQRTRRLRTALRDARLGTLRAVYAPPQIVNDGFTYVLRAAGHTVRVEEGAQGVPRRLQALIAAVSRLLRG